jgi:hypothetical protein
MVSIFGFNYGPEYLYAVKITNLPAYYWVVAASLPGAVLLTAATILSHSESRAVLIREWRYPVLFASLAGLLLIPAIVTIRLEQRWLFAPFALLLLCLCWGAGAAAVGRRQIFTLTGLIALACIGSIVLDQMLSKYFNQIYFIGATQFAEDVKRQFIEGQEAKVDPVILIAGRDQCDWTLANQLFFLLYAGKGRTLICADDVPTAMAARPSSDVPIFAYRPGAGFVRVIGSGKTDANSSTLPMLPARIVSFGPNPVDHGRPFNQQPNGQSAIWVKLDRQADPDFVLAVDGLPLTTHVEGGTLTAAMPSQFFEKPGKHLLRVQVARGGKVGMSPPVSFVVK